MIHLWGVDATMALGHHFDVPIVVFNQVGGCTVVDEFFGNRSPVAYVPNIFLPFSDDMNFFQRVLNTLVEVYTAGLLSTLRSTTNKAIRTYLPGTPSIEDIYKRIAIVLINSHVSVETPRPYLPAMIQIGGFHLQEPEPLPDDLKKSLDEAINGVVYFSFGTNIKVSDVPRLDIFMESLGQLPMKVLLKFDKDHLDNKPDNVVIRSWFPQRGILSHWNTKLFISHGGYGGCTESLYYGVPMICIPFFSEQPKNCRDIELHGVGIHLPLSRLTTETFNEALQKVLFNKKFVIC